METTEEGTWDPVKCVRCGQLTLRFFDEPDPFVCASCKLLEAVQAAKEADRAARRKG